MEIDNNYYIGEMIALRGTIERKKLHKKQNNIQLFTNKLINKYETIWRQNE